MPTTRELTDIAARIVALLEDGDEADIEAASALLDGLAVDVPDKLDALRAVAVRFDAEAALLKAEEARLAKRRKAAERGVDAARARALSLLVGWREIGNGDRIRTATGSFALVAGRERVEWPPDPADWPEAWRRVSVEPNRAAAADAFAAGEPLPDGFRVVRGPDSLRWS